MRRQLGELHIGGSAVSYEHEHAEWHCAVNDLSEFDRAPYDDPQTYDDTMSLDGVRWL